MNQDAEIKGDDETLPLEPAWERRKEVGFFKSILLTIRGVMFRPSETFSRFRWDGGYWHPIFLCLLGGFVVILITSFVLRGYGLINGLSFKLNCEFSGVELIGGLVGLGACLVFLYLFSVVVLGFLRILRVESPSYEGVFRVIAYTSILISILTTAIGFAICTIIPKSLWNPMQSTFEILLMIWQGYCIAVGLSKMTSTPFWKPITAVTVAMILAYGSNEIISINNPIGHELWDGVCRGFTGHHL